MAKKKKATNKPRKPNFNDNQEKRLLLAERLHYQTRMTYINLGQKPPPIDGADGMLTINAHMEAMGTEMSLEELEAKAKVLAYNYEYFNGEGEMYDWERYRIRTLQLMVDICIGELGGVETIIPQMLEEKKRQEWVNMKAEFEVGFQFFKQTLEKVMLGDFVVQDETNRE
jgi:hypothetical protein